ncbi:DEAD-box ATP-dependent RNA helicase 14-like protein [Tanacetum coccineum]
MDVELMWATDHIVALTPSSAITIPETANEFAIKGSSNSDTDKIMAQIDAMTMKIDAQYKELQSNAKKTKPDSDEDDISMSCEEESKFMQTVSLKICCLILICRNGCNYNCCSPLRSGRPNTSKTIERVQPSSHENGGVYIDDDDRYARNGNGGSKFSSGLRGHESGSGLSLDAYRRKHKITVTGDNVPLPFMTFEDTGFSSELLREVLEAGFTAPTLIQAQSWPVAIQSRDIVAIAKRASGKTLGYLLPGFLHLKRVYKNRQMGPTVLVLSPTRELATQIQVEAVKFRKSSKILCTCLYGGAPKGPQLRELERGTDIVVATPGRLNDILEMRKINKEDQVFFDELERLQRQEHDANDAAEALRKEFAQETEDLLLQAGATNTSSTNIVNTASIPVSTVSPYYGLSFSDPTNPDQDDSEIPALKDIYKNPTDGIFTNSSYDDEGAVADFTNLETVVNVSPIPTSRINSNS